MIKTIKICGITSTGDARMVCDLGADMVGVIVDVDVSTPREIEPKLAAEILEEIPDNIESVVVTMPSSVEEAVELSNDLNPDYLQIHNDLPPSKIREIRDKTGVRIIGVFSVSKDTNGSSDEADQARAIAEVSDLLLLDTEGPSYSGGTGESHDWNVSLDIRRYLDTPLILAGGLTPDNVRQGIEFVNPFGIDVASGVEAEPGRKDSKLVGEFIQEVRKYD